MNSLSKRAALATAALYAVATLFVLAVMAPGVLAIPGPYVEYENHYLSEDDIQMVVTVPIPSVGNVPTFIFVSEPWQDTGHPMEDEHGEPWNETKLPEQNDDLFAWDVFWWLRR